MSDSYRDFLAGKRISAPHHGLPTATALPLPPALFDWQAHLVRWALECGRAALFCDTGLGKTAMQLAWAQAVAAHEQRPVLILAPLAVAAQTVREGARFGIPARVIRDAGDVLAETPDVVVCNYDRLDKLNVSLFAGVVLDESSILKSYMGATKRALVESFAAHRWKLCCTATPAPNDYMEFGNHSEFLGVLTSSRMLSRFFINDTGETGVYRLKQHAERAFWEWMASWAVALRTPADLLRADKTPYPDDGYVLPSLGIHAEIVGVDHVERGTETGELFAGGALSATGLHKEMRLTANDRAARVAEIVAREPGEPWVLWCNTDYEADAVRAVIPDAVEVRGSMTPAEKESRLDAFSRGDVRVLLTKPSIAGFGMNWQHCARMAFVGLSYSYEALYQALRRSYRFGQSRAMNAYLVAAESEGAVRDTLTRKETAHREMQAKMAAAMRDVQGGVDTSTHIGGGIGDVREGDGWTVTNGDSVEAWRQMPDASVDFTIFSPPFSNLYIYTDDPRDMGNTADDREFFAHFRYLLPELHRVTRPGRLMAVHCKNLPKYAGRDGVAGIRDFRGDIIREAEAAGWTLHSEVTIWKCPVTEMQRTKAHGLLYKTLRRDASFTRQGMAEYLVVFRRWPADDEEVAQQQPVVHLTDDLPLDLWQRYASPVWMDIDQTRVLNVRVARAGQDEKHLCPLQLDVIERAIALWTNAGDLIASPFTGIGSEGVVALQMARRFVGAELKREYFDWACRNLTDARAQTDLFTGAA